MEPTDIIDRFRSTNARLDRVHKELKASVDKANAELGARIDETNRRITETEIRMTTALIDVVSSVQEVRDLLIDRLDLRDRVERCEQDIDELKRRVY